jgi:hypothetical protein
LPAKGRPASKPLLASEAGLALPLVRLSRLALALALPLALLSLTTLAFALALTPTLALALALALTLALSLLSLLALALALASALTLTLALTLALTLLSLLALALPLTLPLTLALTLALTQPLLALSTTLTLTLTLPLLALALFALFALALLALALLALSLLTLLPRLALASRLLLQLILERRQLPSEVARLLRRTVQPGATFRLSRRGLCLTSALPHRVEIGRNARLDRRCRLGSALHRVLGVVDDLLDRLTANGLTGLLEPPGRVVLAGRPCLSTKVVELLLELRDVVT